MATSGRVAQETVIFHDWVISHKSDPSPHPAAPTPYAAEGSKFEGWLQESAALPPPPQAEAGEALGTDSWPSMSLCVGLTALFQPLQHSHLPRQGIPHQGGFSRDNQTGKCVSIWGLYGLHSLQPIWGCSVEERKPEIARVPRGLPGDTFRSSRGLRALARYIHRLVLSHGHT